MALCVDFLDTPIIVQPGMRVPYPADLKYCEPEDFSPSQAVRHAALFDNKEEYVKGIKSWPSDKRMEDRTWEDLFRYDSVKCATAVLDGETDGRLDLVATLSNHGSSLLHEAARFGANNMTAMLLERGKSADIEVKEQLPLDFAMEKLKKNQRLSDSSTSINSALLEKLNVVQEATVFQTIVQLSGGAAEGELLETVRLLARRSQKLERQFFTYLKEGKVVELVALLMVGCRPSSTSLLKTQDEFLKKEVMVELLETFARIGDKLSAFIRLRRTCYISWDRLIAEISTLFKEGGLIVKCEDTPSDDMFRRGFSSNVDGEEHFIWSQQAQGILNPMYDESFTYPQQVLGALNCSNQGSLSPGPGSFHSSSFLEADRSIASSSQLKSSFHSSVKGLDKEITKLIRSDKDRELISLLNDLPQKKNGYISSSLELWKLICSRRALKCAAALLGRDAGCSVDPNVVLEGGLSPLHLAAQSLFYDLTELFLVHGGQPNLSHDGDHAKLPLGFALEALSHNECVSDWTPKKSIFKLFYILCLPQLEESRKTVKLLASITEDVETLSLSYVCNGQLVQLTALLISAWSKLGPPSSDQQLKECVIGQFILNQLELVSQQESKYLSFGLSSASTVLRESKAKLESAWKILKVLHMSHETLQECIDDLLEMPQETHEVPFYIAELVWMECKIPFLREDVYANDVKW